MSYLKNSLLLISILVAVVGIVFISAWLGTVESISHADLKTILTTTSETLGALLGIITAGLMFTQGKFSELSSELSEKSPEYVTKELSVEKMQSIETQLIAMRKTFSQLAANTTIPEERNLYERIIAKASSIFVDFAVLLNLKLKQQGLPDPGLFVSEMGPNLYRVYEKRRRNIKKDWHVFRVLKEILEAWEAPTASFISKPNGNLALHADLKSSISVLKLKESVDKSSANIRIEVEKTAEDLTNKISKISTQLHKDRIPQLLSQMEQASALRGKYFYLALVFIATPLLLNLLILPQLSEATATFFMPLILITSSLSIMGVAFLLLYIHKILNV